MSEKRRERAAKPGAAARAETLYERYKDSLRRGHVAAMRGELDEALAAYQEASRIAPSRPMARASAGIALARAGRLDEAVSHYDAAVRLAPHDEATRAGRAEALAALGRHAEAAEDLDVVVDVRERAGRIGEALDAATRALELAEARHRRRAVERLVATLEDSELDEPSRAALGGAMRVLDADTVRLQAAPGADGERAAEGADTVRLQAAPGADGERAADPTGEAGHSSPAPAALTETPEPEAAPPLDPTPAAEAAETALDAGDGPAARAHLLQLAAVHGAAGRIDAALDACYLALSVAPDDVDLHLVLVGLYARRGWMPVAIEKLDLLARLASLDGDPEAGERIAAARAGLG